MIGQTLGGRYQIIEQIGRGGFGITYLANDTVRPGNPDCVVKQFKPLNNDLMTLEAGKILFEREAQKLEKLGNYDQIPRLLAYFQENQEFFLVQEYIKGHDLNQEITSVQEYNEAGIIKLLCEILEVLSIVHSENLIHRDIKPSNIRRRQSDSKIVLIDFGAIKEVSTSFVSPTGVTSYTKYIHTPGYAPSEQLKGQATKSSDVYAVGIIGIYALTGIKPESNRFSTNPQTGEIVWRDCTSVKITPELANIIDKMIYDGTRRNERYRDASAALQALKELLPKSQPWKPWISFGTVAAIISVIIWIGFQFTTTKQPKPNLVGYSNSDSSIKMSHPENWKLRKPSDSFGGEVITFIPERQNQTLSCPLELTISVNDLPQILSLEEYKNTVLQKIKNNNPNSQISDASQPSTILSGAGAYKLVYSRSSEQCPLQIMEIGTVKNGKAYYVTYTAGIKEYSQHIEAVEDMINSFQIVEKN